MARRFTSQRFANSTDALRESPQDGSGRAFAALLCGAAAIGFAPIFVRLSDAGPSATAFWRVVIALPVLAVWALSEPPKAAAASPRRVRRLVIVSGLFFAVDLALWHWSIQLTSVANATLFANFAALFVVLFGRIFLHEPITSKFVLAMLVALGGTALLVGANVHLGPRTLLGDALALGAAIFYAGYLLTVKALRSSMSTSRIMTGSACASAPALIVAAVLSGENLIPGSSRGWFAVVALAIFSHAGGQSLIAYALAHLRASFSSVALLLQPVVAAVAAWVLLGEQLGTWQIAGGAAVLCGVALARSQQAEKPDSARVDG